MSLSLHFPFYNLLLIHHLVIEQMMMCDDLMNQQVGFAHQAGS